MGERPVLAQFGAGNIGRSLVGALFSAAGWQVVFVDVSADIVDALNAERRYRVHIEDDVLPGQPEHIDVEGVSGVHLRDGDAVRRLLLRADLAGTAVGAANLPGVCRLVAEILPERESPLPVLLCENLHGAARIAAESLADVLPADSPFLARAAFVEAAISKMVPAASPEQRRRDPLAVRAEAYNTLYLDADAYPGVTPDVPGVAWRSNFAAYVDRKLLVHNFGHAAAAYHGFLAGKRFIWECMEDPEIRSETAGCMLETSRALAVRHGGAFTFDENRAWTDDLLRRLGNRRLGDTVSRVGRDLRRKLAPGDRCIGALRLLQETGNGYEHTARAIAAALFFNPETSGDAHPGDAEVTALVARKGPEAVLTGLCGLDIREDHAAVAAIAGEYLRFVTI